MKQVHFHPKLVLLIRGFPTNVKKALGKTIVELQMGEKLKMPLSRPMPSIATGAYELRLKSREGIYRVFYYTKLEETIILFHAFNKKTQKTPLKEIKVAKQRLKDMVNG